MATNTPNVTFRDDNCILVKNVRISYPHIFKPWAAEADETKKYSAKFILDKKTHAADIKALGAAVAAAMQEAFKGRIPNDKLCLVDGDTLGKDETMGSFVLKASETKRPDVINRDKSRINEEDDIVYAGCYVNVMIRLWAQNNKFGKRINANLIAVQFVRDGERFSGIDRPDADEAFDDISEDFEGVGGGNDNSGGEDDPFA
jgi:hypothetical protein